MSSLIVTIYRHCLIVTKVDVPMSKISGFGIFFIIEIFLHGIKKISNYKLFPGSNNFLLLPNSYDIVHACLKFKFEDLGCLNFMIFKCQTSPNVLLSNFCNDATRFVITFSTERLKTFISQCRSLIHLLKKI